MEIRCLNCRRRIHTADVSVAEDKAFCRKCDRIYSLSGIVTQSTVLNKVEPDNPPPGVQFERISGGFTVKLRIAGVGFPVIIMLLGAFAAGFGIFFCMEFFRANALISKRILACFIMGALALSGILVFVKSISLLFSTLVITAEGDEAVVFKGIGALGKTERFKLSGEWQVWVEPNLHDRIMPKHVVLNGERIIILGEMLPTKRAVFLAGALRKMLDERSREE